MKDLTLISVIDDKRLLLIKDGTVESIHFYGDEDLEKPIENGDDFLEFISSLEIDDASYVRAQTFVGEFNNYLLVELSLNNSNFATLIALDTDE